MSMLSIVPPSAPVAVESYTDPKTGQRGLQRPLGHARYGRLLLKRDENNAALLYWHSSLVLADEVLDADLAEFLARIEPHHLAAQIIRWKLPASFGRYRLTEHDNGRGMGLAEVLPPRKR